MKYVLVLGLITLVTVTFAKVCPGCAETETEPDLPEDFNSNEKYLRELLPKVAALKDGPSYKVVKVNSVGKAKVPVGIIKSIHVINADLKDKNETIKTCGVGIVRKPWAEDGYLVCFLCASTDYIICYRVI